MTLYIIVIVALLIGLSLFIFWRRRRLGGIESFLEHDLFQVVPKQISIDEIQIHYFDEGHGPNLLLIHGIGASSFSWRFLIKPLSRKYRVITIDLPGFGKSAKHIDKDYGLDAQSERIEKFLTSIGVDQCRLVGSSMGGGIALWLARRNPQRFFEVACISPATSPKLVRAPLKNLSLISKPLRLGLNRMTASIILNRVIENKASIDHNTLEQYFDPYFNEPDSIKTFFKATEAVRDPRLSLELSNIQSRIMVLWGQKDRVVPIKYMNDLKCKLPNAVYSVHESAGHHVHEDEPGWVLQSLLQFFGDDDI